MCSPMKILVCVALVCVSANGREIRDVIASRTSLPNQWQLPNGINGLPNGFSYSSNSGAGDSGVRNGQRQPQFSEGLGYGQTIGAKILRPSVESNQIPFLEQQRPGVVVETINPSVWLNAQRVGNQNIYGQGRSLGDNILLNPSQISTLRLNHVNNGVSPQFLESQRSGQISGARYNLLEDTSDVSQENNEEQVNARETQSYGLGAYSERSRQTNLQSQRGGYSNQQGIQEELRGSNKGRNQLWVGAERQSLQPTRYGPGINIASRPEAVEEAVRGQRTNLGVSLNSYQPQRDINQNNIAQQQPHIYSYGELSAKILKVIQSNPSMLSNMNGLMEQLQNDNDSGNQETRQLKSLLQEIGKYNRNPSPVGASLDKQQQQNALVQNLLEVMSRNQNNQNGWNIPISRQKFSRHY